MLWGPLAGGILVLIMSLSPEFCLGLSLLLILAICIFLWADATVCVYLEVASLR
ncbi:hypothetical protein DPMN_111915 [Dreissena polymorpha]|uniref:Uncharacterized protein n=1 Tax=Dreissena polymorpha TaxID=45954 RepID=A0A9D4KEP3_DREPO|nr:hypothetical protein DPMN_111848 [Dreissena polymorpha]KAH3838505.1 hypothetical protein DPMN_111915 [Dreissena polymorpha]